jgi:hypothetical protein
MRMKVAAGSPSVVYIHGAGNKPPADDLKRSWDRDLFGQDMGQRTRIAYYADLLHEHPGAVGPDACSDAEALAAIVEKATEPRAESNAEPPNLFNDLTVPGQEFAFNLSMSMATRAASQTPVIATSMAAILPLPAPLRRLLLRKLLEQVIPDANGYFFTSKKEPIRERLRGIIQSVDGPVIVVSHSFGTVVAYDVLSEPGLAGGSVSLLVTLGAPLGYAEIQDVITTPLRVPRPVRLWINFADPLDLVTLDTTLADDFGGSSQLVDATVDNPSPNNHAACGYLGLRQVQATVAGALFAVTDAARSRGRWTEHSHIA